MPATARSRIRAAICKGFWDEAVLRSNRKDWLAIICTATKLDEKEIIRIYGKRRDIELPVFS